ncbi:oxygen tolerance protein BatD [Breznakibacter xylanolyticus]|uniref:Oxygen tolerance protein BatD n=1 Tax=Breznakibacter xylanolyticus TaxID=990 RepID=A0A2W7N2W0_9BACT|nr:BatD family protein [Breznakibacter xylanolyticus]PZX14410.1 oxygen tolerance protein BatD [Breznakibacter xylanolyticus]
MKKILSILTLIILTFTSSQAQKLKADAPRAVIAGEKFQLRYSIDTEASDLRLPVMDNDIQILMGPSTTQSTNMTIVNGNVQRNSTYAFTYILKIDQPGKYTIPSATITSGGKKIESNAIELEVVKGDDKAAARQSTQADEVGAAQISGDELMLVVTANRKEVFKDEPIVLTTKIYVRDVALQGISSVKNPELRDFISQELPRKENIEWTIENINGKTYNVGVYEQKLLFPQKTGSLTISPVEIEFLIKQRVARRSQSIFDEFFESNYRNVKKLVASKPLNIQVKNLPTPAPSDFSGVVGSIKMDVSTSKNQVKTNDGVTIKLVVSGSGNHKLMNTPKMNIPSDFDQFDPKVTNDINNTVAGMSGSKTFEYLVIPRHAGDFTIPPVTLSYFDIHTKQYKQLSSGNITINVEKGSGDESAAVIQQFAASREDLKFIGKDIRYIKTDKGKMKPRGSFLYGSLMFWVLMIVPVIGFIIFILVIQKQLHDSANVIQTRHRKASKLATKRLKQASHLLKTGHKEGFYDELLRALWGYMGDKLKLPVAQLSRDNASNLMSQMQVPEGTIQRFMNILDTCEFARYAPASGSAEMDKLYHETIETITLLENQMKGNYNSRKVAK